MWQESTVENGRAAPVKATCVSELVLLQERRTVPGKPRKFLRPLLAFGFHRPLLCLGEACSSKSLPATRLKMLISRLVITCPKEASGCLCVSVRSNQLHMPRLKARERHLRARRARTTLEVSRRSGAPGEMSFPVLRWFVLIVSFEVHGREVFFKSKHGFHMGSPFRCWRNGSLWPPVGPFQASAVSLDAVSLVPQVIAFLFLWHFHSIAKYQFLQRSSARFLQVPAEQ